MGSGSSQSETVLVLGEACIIHALRVGLQHVAIIRKRGDHVALLTAALSCVCLHASIMADQPSVCQVIISRINRLTTLPVGHILTT